MADSMGGLYASVTLDIDDALRQLKALESAMRQTAARAGRGTGGRAGSYDWITSGAIAAQRAMITFAAASEKAQKAHIGQLRALQQTGVEINKHRQTLGSLEKAYGEATDAVQEWQNIIKRQFGDISAKRMEEVHALRQRREITQSLAAVEKERVRVLHDLALAQGRLGRAQAAGRTDLITRYSREAQNFANRLKAADIVTGELNQELQGVNATLNTGRAHIARYNSAMEQMVTAERQAAAAQGRLTAARNAAFAVVQKQISQATHLRQVLAQTGGSIARSFSSMSNVLRPAGGVVQALGVAQSSRSLYVLGAAVRSVATAFQQSGKAAGAYAAAIAVLAVTAIATYYALKTLARGIFEIAKQGVTAGMEIERLSIAFETLLGSASAAQREIRFIQQEAITSPFMTETVLQLDRFLLAQGFAMAGLRQQLVTSTLDIGAAVGLTNQQLEQLSYALGQVRNAGRLTGDEARQLTNSFLNWQQVLRTLPKYAEMSGLELKRMQEKGLISAQDFFTGYLIYAEKFAGASDKMAESLFGVWQNLQDIATFNLGQAFAGLEFGKFIDLSPVKILTGYLDRLQMILKAIDFRPLAYSIGAIFRALFGQLGRWLDTRGTELISFFESKLPTILIWVANTVMDFATIMKAVGQVIGEMFEIAWETIKWFGRQFTSQMDNSGDNVSSFADIVGVAAGAIVGIFQLIANASKALYLSIKVMVDGIILAFKTLDALIPFAGGGWSDVGTSFDTFMQDTLIAGEAWSNIMDGVGERISEVSSRVSETLDGLSYTIKNVDFDVIPQELKEPLGDIADSFADSAGAAEEAAGKTAEAMRKIADAMNELYDLTRRWFRMRSELEKGFLGDKGFEGTVDSIVSMGKRLIELLRIIGASSVVRYVRAATMELIELARERERLAERLTKAEQKLADAIQAQADLANTVRDAAQQFVLSLQLADEEITTYTKLTEEGYFFQRVSKETKSFKQQLQERLRTLREFARNIRELRKRGLSGQLIQELLAAGPEAGGAVASQLAEGSQAQIKQVNKLSKAARATAKKLGDYAGKQFKQAGIDQAQALVDGIQSKLDAITKTAKAITSTIYEAILPFAVEMEDLGEELGNSMAGGIGGAGPGIGDAAVEAVSHISKTRALVQYNQMASAVVNEINSNWDAWSTDKDTMAPFNTIEEKVSEAIRDIHDRIELDMSELEIKFSGTVEYASALAAFWKALYMGLAPFATGIMAKMFPENKQAYEIAKANYLLFSSSTDKISFGSPVTGGTMGTSHGTASGGGGGSSSLQNFSVETSVASPRVNVYIGDQELRNIVRTEVVAEDDNNVRFINAGRVQ